MPRVQFAQDMLVKFCGRICRIVEKLPDETIKLRDTKTDTVTIHTYQGLVKAFFDGELEFYVPESGGKKNYKKADYTLSDDSLQIEAKRKEDYVKACLALAQNRCSGKTLEPIIAEVAEQKGEKAPSASSVYRWRKSYVDGGMDIRALIPLYVNRGNATPRLDPDVYTLIDEVVHEDFLQLDRITVAEACERLENKIDLDNKYRASRDQLTYPDRSTIYRMIDKIDPFDKAAARYGVEYARRLYDPAMQGPRPTRPLERVEIDNTTLPFFVVDEQSRLPLGLANLTGAICAGTKYIWGFHLGFEPYSSLTVMNCLKHAIRDKSYVKEQYPEIVNTYDSFGLAETIFCDNGKDYLGKPFQDACDQVGMNLEYAPIKMPWYKASIENYFGKIAKSLLQNLPGQTFSRLFKDDGYDPLKHAVISFDALMEILHIWIIDIYHQRFHRGIQGVPAKRWQEGIKKYPPALPQQLSDLDAMLGIVEERIVSKSGIEFLGLYYNSEKLAAFRRTIEPGQKVKLKVDPTDISFIRVFTPFESISVPAVSQEYTRGLSLWQHNVIRRLARQEAKSVDIKALNAAKRKINEIVEREIIFTKKTSTRAKMARWMGIGRNAVGAKGTQASNIPETVELLPRGQEGGLNGVSDIGSFVAFPTSNGKEVIVDSTDDLAERMKKIEETVRTGAQEGWAANYKLPVQGKEDNP